MTRLPLSSTSTRLRPRCPLDVTTTVILTISFLLLPFLFREEYEGGPKHAMRHMLPFGATGTATFPGHRFLMTEANKPDNILQAFVIKEYPENIYYYDPYHVPDDPVQTEKNLADNLKTDEERKYYNQWRKTILFNEQYKAKTGRSYLANYLRAPPRHYMWPADYIDQEHWVTTKETHFVSLPPSNSPELKEINSQKPRNRILAEDAPRLLQEYREPDTEVRNLTLKVLSVAPRVYQIDNFLSPTEVEHIMELAKGIELAQSTVGETHKGEEVIGEEEKTSKTRTSYNSWVPRERTPVVDAVYRRAADVLRIDESLLRSRAEDEEWSIKTGTRRGIAEQLQLVHYGKRQEYTAHHDFGFSHISSETQDARFATLLLYLNEDVEGGETSFPRWVNDRTFHPLKIKPKTGMAALFYSQLPDGNLDDFSQHAAEPVKSGEKVRYKVAESSFAVLIPFTHPYPVLFFIFFLFSG